MVQESLSPGAARGVPGASRAPNSAGSRENNVVVTNTWVGDGWAVPNRVGGRQTAFGPRNRFHQPPPDTTGSLRCQVVSALAGVELQRPHEDGVRMVGIYRSAKDGLGGL